MPREFLNQKKILWIKLFVWCGVIAALSSVPSYAGKGVDFETGWGIFQFCLRKFAHLFEYGVLMILANQAIEGTWEKLKGNAFLISFLFAFFFAVSDEWHQSFVFGRNGTPFDVWVDSVGAFLGYGLLVLKRKGLRIFSKPLGDAV